MTSPDRIHEALMHFKAEQLLDEAKTGDFVPPDFRSLSS